MWSLSKILNPFPFGPHKNECSPIWSPYIHKFWSEWGRKLTREGRQNFVVCWYRFVSFAKILGEFHSELFDYIYKVNTFSGQFLSQVTPDWNQVFTKAFLLRVSWFLVSREKASRSLWMGKYSHSNAISHLWLLCILDYILLVPSPARDKRFVINLWQ